MRPLVGRRAQLFAAKPTKVPENLLPTAEPVGDHRKGSGEIISGLIPVVSYHQKVASSVTIRIDPARLPTTVGGVAADVLHVLIAEDQFLLREGTRRLLEEVPGVEVVGEASDYDDVLAETRRLRPDVVLMDIKMPPTHTMEGIEAAHVIKAEQPETGVVVLSQHEEEGYVWALLEGGVAGLGYLHKLRVGDIHQLVRALYEVAAGGSVVDPRILESLLERRSKKPGSALSRLTPRESEVLVSMAEGKTNSAIASELSIAVGTVEKRISTIFSELGLGDESDVNRRVAAVLVYLRESLGDS